MVLTATRSLSATGTLGRQYTVKNHPILEEPSPDRRHEFLSAVARSRNLHQHWAHPPGTTEDFNQNLERFRSGTHIGYWVCTENGDLAGAIDISEIDRRAFRSGHLAYYAFVPHSGHGYMTKGLGAVLDDAFGLHRLHRLEAYIDPDNEASRQLVQRCGFRLEGLSPRTIKVAGRWRNLERWAIVSEEWTATGPLAV